MRVLVAGAAGMLAREVIDACGRRGHDVTALGRARLDITDPRSIERAIQGAEPDAVINCAAWSDVDGAEDDERGAMAVNDTGAAMLASAAARAGASVLYPSSDYVFDGQGRRPYLEEDMPAPIGAYGRSKLGGEVSVAAANARHFIVRSSWLYGHGGKNFVETMLRVGDEQSEVLVVSDQRGCPTACVDLGEAMAKLIESEEYGIHHIRGDGECTWFDFAQEIYDQAGMETRVMAATTRMLARKAQRPAYSVLGHSRDFVIELPQWQRSLRRYLDDRELVR
ncbi:MAG: dTDP-4-dehydrorhamnose reductase [Actinomycetota bacterium]|nr:dTDP-4-dehydrorhamnose reductase [Actinomycetota bacterium]